MPFVSLGNQKIFSAVFVHIIVIMLSNTVFALF